MYPIFNTGKKHDLKVRPIDADSNVMAIYLAQHVAAKWTQMIIIKNILGKIFMIWSNDMGLGPVEEQFLGA